MIETRSRLVARQLDSAWRVTGIYAVLTLATTWPLALHLTRSLPADLGDPLLNCFILQWGVDHLLTLARGDMHAMLSYWNAPIFHPEPLALAYSEHLFAQVVQAAPVFAATQNILLAYNLLFLSSFVLSGLGMYLLARELTGSAAAGFAAGLVYAFGLYRVAQFPHLQALSAQWLPFALYGLRRFFTTRRLRPLLGATLALVVQNLSNGYYLIFFTPFVVAYCLFELLERGLWRDMRVVMALAISAFAVVVATLPFLVPYLLVRIAGFGPRGLDEVERFSADLLSWLSAAPHSRAWGWMRGFRKPEGELFTGLVTLILAGLGVAGRLRTLWSVPPAPRWRRVMTPIVIALLAILLGFVSLVLGTRDDYWRLFGVRITLRDPTRVWIVVGLLLVTLIAISPRIRRIVAGLRGSALGFFAVGAVAGVLLSLGPVIHINGNATALPAPYALLYYHVPGFDGLRVPARYAMLTMCCLGVLAGYGARALAGRGRTGARVLLGLCGLLLMETTSMPIGLDGRLKASPGYEAGLRRPSIGDDVPPVYHYLRNLPVSSVVIEFPFGAPAWDLQAVYFQPIHGRPIVNGYSGFFPQSFRENVDAFDAMTTIPAVAWSRLVRSGATHVVVHRAGFKRNGADMLERWLLGRGAHQIADFGSDRVFAVASR